MTGPLLDPAAESNASIDDDAAAAHLCGMTHLPTGRVCRLPARHPESCEFEAAGTP